jgi:hypothetical protein
MAQILKPGHLVPTTGIYKVVHDKDRVPPHHVTAISGSRFPGCLTCHDRVRFELLMAAVQMIAHPQFYRSSPSFLQKMWTWLRRSPCRN